MSRAFTLTQDVDDTKATARYEDGVLTLDLPKKAGGSSHRIAVK
jgi:HSP20 family protein